MATSQSWISACSIALLSLMKTCIIFVPLPPLSVYVVTVICPWVSGDHKNLTHHLMEFTTQCILCWCLLLEEFQPIFFDKKGPSNILADTLSHVPLSQTERESPRATSMADAPLAKCLYLYPLQVEFPYSNPYDQAVLANSQSTSMVTSNAYDQVVLANDLPMQAQMTPQTKRSHMVPKKKPSWTTQPLMTKVAYHFTILHYICISNTVSPSFNSWYKS